MTKEQVLAIFFLSVQNGSIATQGRFTALIFFDELEVGRANSLLDQTTR
jgi:hypothetical protein